METGRAAFLALYVPTIIFSFSASFLFFKAIIIPAARKKDLTIEHHGLAIAIVLGLAMDLIENLYYGIGRLHSVAFPAIQSAYPAMIGIKISVMTTSIIALVTYFRITGRECGLKRVILWGIVLWLVAFIGLINFHHA